MPIYTCKCCHFTTKIKTHYANHLKTKKHQKCSSNVALCSSNVALCSSNETIHQCKFCKKVLKHRSSLYRHISKYCKQNTNENELLQLVQDKYNQIENMQKQIDILTSKLNNQNI